MEQAPVEHVLHSFGFVFHLYDLLMTGVYSLVT